MYLNNSHVILFLRMFSLNQKNKLNNYVPMLENHHSIKTRREIFLKMVELPM